MINFQTKKAQIGETLTWFVGFLIIFFIIVLFLSATFVVSARKKVVFGNDEIILEKKYRDLDNQRILLSFLNKEVIFEGRVKIKDLFSRASFCTKEEKDKIEKKIKEEIEKMFENSMGKKGCYVIDAGVLNKEFLNFCSFSINADYRFKEYLEKYKNDLLKKATEFELFSDNGKIKIKFYFGECL